MMDYDRLIELVNDLKGKSANVITSFLKEMSGSEDGTMPDGMKNIIEICKRDREIAVANAKRSSGVVGLVTGVIGATAVVGGLWWQSNKKKQEEHDKECERIIATFKKAAEEEKENYEKLQCQPSGTKELVSDEEPTDTATESE